MAISWARLGSVGAVLLLVGLGLVGSGFAANSLIEQSTVNCDYGSNPGNCAQLERNADNASFAVDYVISAGLILTGFGLFLTVLAMVTIMAHRDDQAATHRGPAYFPPSGSVPPPPLEPPPNP
ncbi:MAG: hypothetical protein WA691_03280 [Thermoplasmata archaeon]